jgi:hypothetical protein
LPFLSIFEGYAYFINLGGNAQNGARNLRLLSLSDSVITE